MRPAVGHQQDDGEDALRVAGSKSCRARLKSLTRGGLGIQIDRVAIDLMVGGTGIEPVTPSMSRKG